MRTSCARSMTSPWRAARALIGRRRSKRGAVRNTGLKHGIRCESRRGDPSSCKRDGCGNTRDRPIHSRSYLPFALLHREGNREQPLPAAIPPSPFESRALFATGESSASRRGAPPFSRAPRRPFLTISHPRRIREPA